MLGTVLGMDNGNGTADGTTRYVSVIDPAVIVAFPAGKNATLACPDESGTGPVEINPHVFVEAVAAGRNPTAVPAPTGSREPVVAVVLEVPDGTVFTVDGGPVDADLALSWVGATIRESLLLVARSHPGAAGEGEGNGVAYPAQLTVYCDDCGLEVTGDYVVKDSDDGPTRYEYARTHLRTQGWKCDNDGDLCPSCQAT